MSQGLGHIGLLRTLFEDLRGVNLKQKYLDNLASSSENFIRMWETADAI